jgi:hypothetical protein
VAGKLAGGTVVVASPAQRGPYCEEAKLKKPLLIPCTMLILIGIGVFMLPSILGGQEGNVELAERTGTIGGALIGVGLFMTLLVLISKKK